MSIFRTKFLYFHMAMIICFSILLSTGMLRGRKVYVDRQEQYVQERVNNIMLEIVKLLEPYYQLSEDIAVNRDIISLRNRRLSSEDMQMIWEVYESLRLEESGIREIGIYFAASNTIVTNGRIYRDSQVNHFFDRYGRTITGRYLCENTAPVYRNIRGEDSGLLLRKLYDSYGVMGCLILEYDLEEIADIPVDDMQLYIGNNDDYLYAQPECSADTYREIIAGTGTREGFYIEEEKYYVFTSLYSKLNTAVRVAVPESTFYAGSGAFTIWIYLGIFLGILSGVPLAVYFVFHMLKPAQRLADVVRLEEKKVDLERVMEEAGQRIYLLERKNSSIAKENRYFLPFAIGEKLNRVLETKGSCAYQACADTMEMTGLDPGKSAYLFAIHILRDRDGIFQNNENEPAISSYHVMNNILSEKIFEKSKGFLCSNLNFMPALVQENEKGTYTSLVQDLEECRAFMEEHFHVTLAISRPIRLETSRCMQDAYNKTQEEISSLEFWQKDQYMGRDRERNAAERVPYFKIVRNLVNKLEDRDYRGATELFYRVIDEYMPTAGQRSWRIDRYQIYALAGIIITAACEQSNQEKKKEDAWKVVSKIYHIRNIDEFRKEYENVLEDYLSAGENAASSGSDKIEEIQRYILENYTDNTLNVSSIANRFGKSKSHLSHLFKDAAGINISEYIQRLRVEKAKELLVQYSVKDVVRMSGFWDSQALTRAMKKYEGITPGELKKHSTPSNFE